jgi:hypothetical protein
VNRLLVFCASLLLLSVVTSARAFQVTQTYQFTGADLMNYEFKNGGDGSTAADNELFDGARLRRAGGGSSNSRTYWTSEQSAFTNWATTTNDRFFSFNLWGLDGLATNWGEHYKVDYDYEHDADGWGSQDQPDGWTAWRESYSTYWGSPPDDYRTETFIGWDAQTLQDGLNFHDPDLAERVFRFSVMFETDNMWWGDQNANGAPNSLWGPKTFWFGGWFGNGLSNPPPFGPDDEPGHEKDNYAYMYEGNMVLTPLDLNEVPEPTTLGLLGIGLVGGGLRMIRRRRAK